MKFLTLVYGLIAFVIGSVIVLTVLPAILPTFYNGLNDTNSFSWSITTNATGHTLTSQSLPFSTLFAIDGILPLVLVAAVFIALVVGAIAMIKTGKKR